MYIYYSEDQFNNIIKDINNIKNKLKKIILLNSRKGDVGPWEYEKKIKEALEDLSLLQDQMSISKQYIEKEAESVFNLKKISKIQ